MKWVIVFVGHGVWGPFSTRRAAIEWADGYAREHDLRGSFLVHKFHSPSTSVGARP